MFGQMWQYIEFTALALVLFWVVIRYLIVRKALTKYEVSARTFLILDIVTTPPYVWGLVGVAKAIVLGDWLVFIVRSTTALASFLIPYLYLWIKGRETMPKKVKWAIAGWCGVFSVMAVREVVAGI